MCQARRKKPRGVFVLDRMSQNAPRRGNWLRLVHSGFRGLRGVMVRFILGRGWRSKILRTSLPALLDPMKAEARNGGNP